MRVITFKADDAVQALIEGERQRLQDVLEGSRVTMGEAIRSLLVRGSREQE